ncbi:MAG: arylsulfatase [Luteolibacter sp.]|uniref:arylsulfatase n=1 Tax=Luteolibacter sp. TaxID=1962973 RepID=UPI003267F89A
MKRNTLLLFLLSLAETVSAADKPNIIVILADDMGYSDIGCYGGEIPTPNLDALAKDGLRFTEFYNTGRCCPTRASLLTGLYSHQAGIGHMNEDDHLPGYQGHLNDTCVTMAEVLKPAGYFTAMTGKWHVGQAVGVTPWGRGFERNLTAAAGGFYHADSDRAKLFLNGEKLASDDPRLPKDWYSTDLWTDYGIKFIGEAVEAKKPFFLYLAENAPHFPLQAPAEDIAKFRHGIYQQGWDKLREARYERQKAMGLIDPKWELTPRDADVKAWDSLSTEEKDRFDHIMSIYAACVWHMDMAIGRLVASLKEKGVYDNTLILFMSDNGGNAESGPNGTLEGKNPGGPGSTVFCGESWANLENTPNRLYKHFNHEGGISTPLIAHWPAGISAKGEFRKEPGHLIDIMATVADFGGATYPKEFGGKEIQPMEGRSLRPAFEDKPIEREAIFWEHEGNAAVRTGDWKLVRKGLRGEWELYDLLADRTEMHNLAAKEPERVKTMTELWRAWAKRANVMPKPGAAGAAKKQARKAAASEPE